MRLKKPMLAAIVSLGPFLSRWSQTFRYHDATRSAHDHSAAGLYLADLVHDVTVAV